MEDRNKKRKIGLEEKVVFITNIFGSWVVAAFFATLNNIVGILLGIYFVINFFCFMALVEKYSKE